MKNIQSRVGMGLFWLFWPLWYLHFKLQPWRSRVLIVSGDEVLLLRGWLSDGKFGLAGGGKHRSETMLHSAVRELREETGIDVPESSLESLGKQWYKRNGIRYRADCFVLRLNDKPNITLRRREIIEAVWLTMEEAKNIEINPEVLFAIVRFKPATQESLL